MISRYTIILLIVFVTFGLKSRAQVHTYLNNLPVVEDGEIEQLIEYSKEEKMRMLSLLPSGDSVQFELPDYDPKEKYLPRYYPLDLKGVYIVDLDFDGDLDLLYSGQSGWATLRDTKMYLNRNGQLEYLKTLNGGLLDLKIDEQHIEITTLWVPCCDSYTSRIEVYDYPSHKFKRAETTYFISVIGLRSLSGMPDFERLKNIAVDQLELYAFPEDFKGTSPYFRSRNISVKDSLKLGLPVKLLIYNSKVRVKVIAEKTRKEQSWKLVITENLFNAPESLYEWSLGYNRRFVGWIKAGAIK